MPPKKNETVDLLKLQQKFQKDKKALQKQKDIKSKKEKTSTGKIVFENNQDKEIRKELKIILEKLQNKTINHSEIYTKINNNKNIHKSKKQLFEYIFKDLSLEEELSERFIQSFLNQNNHINEFYNNYEPIQEKIMEKQKEADDQYIQEQQNKQQSPKKEKQEKTEKEPKKIRFLDDIEKISKPVKQKNVVNCGIEFTGYIPWLHKILKSVWIQQVSGEIDKYVYNNVKKKMFGKIWHKANNNFKKLLCDYKSVLSFSKKDNVLNITNKNLSVKIAYETINNEFIIQDKNIYDNQREYFSNNLKTRNQSINEILKSDIDFEIKHLGLRKLAEALNKIAPNNVDYGYFEGEEFIYNTEFIKETIDNIQENKTSEFFRKIGEVIIYLDLDVSKDNIFKNRVIQGYYIPSVLINLTVKQKLPEYFEDPNITQKEINSVIKIINNNVKDFVNSMGEIIYQYKNPTKNIPTKSKLHYSFDPLNVRKWKKVCDNKEDVENLDPEDLVYYKEDEEVYCFTIPYIVKLIKEQGKKAKNPYTGNLIDSDFKNDILNTYGDKVFSDKNSMKEQEEEKEGKKEEEKEGKKQKGVKEQILAPNLFEVMFKEIQKLKLEEEEQEVEQEVEQEEKKSYSGYSPVENDNTCKFCKSNVDTENCFKTIMDSVDGFKTVYFCSTKCFENQKKWPRPKIK